MDHSNDSSVLMSNGNDMSDVTETGHEEPTSITSNAHSDVTRPQADTSIECGDTPDCMEGVPSKLTVEICSDSGGPELYIQGEECPTDDFQQPGIESHNVLSHSQSEEIIADTASKEQPSQECKDEETNILLAEEPPQTPPADAVESLSSLDSTEKLDLNEPIIASILLVQNSNNLYVHGLIQGIPISCLLDTGASITIIDGQLWRESPEINQLQLIKRDID